MLTLEPEIPDRNRVVRILGWVTAMLFTIVFTSGVWLIFFYQPTAARAWNDFSGLKTGAQAGLVIRSVHNLSSWLVVVSGLGWFAALAVRHRWQKAAYAIPWIATGSVAFITGIAIAWDQLALRAVTVGTNIRGFEPIFTDDVAFVLVNGTEVSVGQVRLMLAVHVLCGVGLAAGTWLTVRMVRARHSQPARQTSTGSEGQPRAPKA